MFINNPFHNAFGLDIGDSSLKLVRLEKKVRLSGRAQYEAPDIRQISLPAGCIVGGEIRQPELAREKIKLLLDKQNDAPAIRTSWVVADLPVSKTFLKLIRISAPENEVNDETMRLEATKHLPLDIKEMDIDWQIIHGQTLKPSATFVLLGATPKNIVKSYSNLLKSAALTPLALEIEDISIARAMITANKEYQGEARAILDLGGSRSSLIIYDKGSIQFSSLLNFSGDLIDNTIIDHLKIEPAAATALKNKNGLNYSDQYPSYLKIVTELSEKLVDNIYQAIMFYRDHFYEPNPVTHITMSGGLSALINLDKFLSDKLQIESTLGNVWKNLFNPSLEKENGKDLAMASAIGLALKAAEWPIIK
ncbi:MAG: pilus assembly protein PilM [Candidatus Magasanikbacteria bacterium]|nr:pilus assembly protein PilM [Candidatus Magasanikbacteria bacterium]